MSEQLSLNGFDTSNYSYVDSIASGNGIEGLSGYNTYISGYAQVLDTEKEQLKKENEQLKSTVAQLLELLKLSLEKK